MTDDELKQLVLEASLLAGPVALKTNAPERLRQRLYSVLKNLDVSFKLVIPPVEGELWLLPKN